MTIEEKITLWNLVNQTRREVGLSELLFADFQAFLGDFRQLSISFDAIVSDAVTAQQND